MTHLSFLKKALKPHTLWLILLCIALLACACNKQNLSAQSAVEANEPSSEAKAIELPLCTQWPPKEFCLIPKELLADIKAQSAINSDNVMHVTPLMVAADADAVQALIDAGADVHAYANNNSVLMHALALTKLTQKDDGRVQILLEAGAQIKDDAKTKRDIEKTGKPFPFTVAINYGFMGYTPLMMAWTLDQTKALVEHGADVNEGSLTGMTPLILALGNHQLDIAKYLIEHGADVNAQTRDGLTPLSVAPDAESVKLLIAHGADVHAVPQDGLFLTNVNAGKMRALIDAGFDIHTRYFNSSPLILAKDTETAKLLIDAGLDVNEAANDHIRAIGLPLYEMFAFEGLSPQGLTPLDKAVAMDNVELAEFYFRSGAKIEKTRFENELILVASPKMKDILLKNGIDVNAKGQDGNTPLARVDNLEDAKYLLKVGAKIDKTQYYPNLWRIADVELAKLLIEQRCDINDAKINQNNDLPWFDSDAQPPIMLTNDPEVIKLLLREGADIHIINQQGQSVLMRADALHSDYMNELAKLGILREVSEAEIGYTKIAENSETAIKAREAKKRSVERNREVIRILVEAGADVNVAAYDGTTALTYTDDLESIKFLLAAGANPNGGKAHKPPKAPQWNEEEIDGSNNNDRPDETLPQMLPIIQAVTNVEALKLLIDAGADVHAQSRDGFTALSAVFFNQFAGLNMNMEQKRAAARMLVEAGADINQITDIKNHGDFRRESVLCFCVSQDDIESVKLALELGANVKQLCRNEPMLMQSKSTEMTKLLLEAGADPNAAEEFAFGAKYPVINYIASRNPQDLKLLLEAGADPNAEDDSGKTPLYMILTDLFMPVESRREFAQMLIQAGSDINHKTTRTVFGNNNEPKIVHETALSSTVERVAWQSKDVQSSCSECVKKCDDRWKVQECKDECQSTCEREQGYLAITLDTLKLIIELGADVHVLCEDNKKLTDWTDNAEAIQILRDAGVKC